MASAPDPSRSAPGDAGRGDAAAMRYALPRFNLVAILQDTAVDLNRVRLATLPVLPALRIYRLLAPRRWNCTSSLVQTYRARNSNRSMRMVSLLRIAW